MSIFDATRRPQNNGFDNGSLLDNIAKLYLNQKTADVNFVFVSCNTRVPAHKNLLAATSDVFAVMFFGASLQKDQIEMKDVSADAFKEFLQFFYQTHAQLTSKNIAEVMHLGHMYNVTRCFDDCVQFYKTNLPEMNICFGIELAVLFDHVELLKTCEKRIIADTKQFFQTADFLDCEKRVLEHILNMNLLSCSEYDVFEACMSWVKAKSKQGLLSKKVVTQYLGELFYEIRFASMTLQELTYLTASYDSVLSDDFKNLAKMITLPNFHVHKFKRNRREIHWRENAIIKCNRESSEELGTLMCLKAKNVTKFTTNEPILFGGFVCAKVIALDDKNFQTNLLVDVDIVEIDTSEIEYSDSDDEIEDSDSDDDDCGIDDNYQVEPLLSFKACIQKSKNTHIYLPKPILIRPEHSYEIRIKHFTENHFIYTKEMHKVLQIHPDVTINFTPNEDDIEGLITILKFNLI